MASLVNDPNGKKRILFVGPDGVRRAIYLGRCDQKTALAVKVRVEALLAAKLAGTPIPQDTAAWLGKIGPELREKLVQAGLIQAERASVGISLKTAIENYLSRQTHVKPASLLATRQAMRNLEEFFGADRPIQAITPAEADDFLKWLLTEARSRKQQHGKPGLTPATAAKRLERVKALFRDCVRRRLLCENPFADVRNPLGRDRERDVYVPASVILKLIEEAPNLEWKLLLSMARFMGIRVPSEAFSLTWDCVDWKAQVMKVPAPKTEVCGKPYRFTPIFPPIQPLLAAVFEAAPPGSLYVFEKLRERESIKAAEKGFWANVNLRQGLLRLLRRIGQRPWPRLWHSLRASCQTDLAARFPIHVVCEWLGNTPRVAHKSYLRVTETDWQRAVKEPWPGFPDMGGESGAEYTSAPYHPYSAKYSALGAQNTAQQAEAAEGKMEKILTQSLMGFHVMPENTTPFCIVNNCKVAGTGFEPPQKNPDFSGISENHSAKYSALKDGGVTIPPELGEILEVWDSLSPQQKEAFRRFVNGQQGE